MSPSHSKNTLPQTSPCCILLNDCANLRQWRFPWAAIVADLPTPACSVCRGPAACMMADSSVLSTVSASRVKKDVACPLLFWTWLCTRLTVIAMKSIHARRTEITEIPGNILDVIMEQSVGQDLRAGCRLATTCKQLWTMQLPSSVHRQDIAHRIECKEETIEMRFHRA